MHGRLEIGGAVYGRGWFCARGVWRGPDEALESWLRVGPAVGGLAFGRIAGNRYLYGQIRLP